MVRFFYIALVPAKAKKKDKMGIPVLTYDRHPFLEDFPDATTWDEAMKTIPNKGHFIMQTNRKVQVRPVRYEYVSHQTIDKTK